MEKEVRVIKMTPDQLGYKDRGIMKWQGFILSAQTDALKKSMKKREKVSLSRKIKCLKKRYLKSCN